MATSQQVPTPAMREPAGVGDPPFAMRVLDDLAGAMAGYMCAFGDRLGLFAMLAHKGPCTPAELAAHSGLDERYARDWLGCLASRGYLSRDDGRYALPPEHAVTLAAEGTPMFMGGAFDQLTGIVGPFAQLADAARSGSGVPAAAYGADMHRGMERMSAAWFENLLVPVWLAALPDAQRRLHTGGDVADVGCGAGRAVIALAEAFPRSRFHGFDVFAPSLDRARARAAAAGVTGRVTFEHHDAVRGLPGRYDLVTLFDVLHDIAQPVDVLAGIRDALKPEGAVLLVEMNGADRHEDNTGPIATILLATSVLYCLPTSIAAGADGLGTLGLPEPRVREFSQRAGFSSARRLPVDTPFNALYELRP